MDVVIDYRSPPSRGGEPHCFSSVRAEYDSLSFAVQMSKKNAVGPCMDATSFIITDRDNRFLHLAEWTLVDGEWVEGLH
jgi:hypothetical protein